MPSPYHKAFTNANKAHELYDNDNMKESFHVYTDAIADFIFTYKHDTDTERKQKIFPVIQNAIAIAERIKLLLQMPSIQKDKSEGIKMIGGTL